MKISKLFRGVALLIVITLLVPIFGNPFDIEVSTVVSEAAVNGYALYSGGQDITGKELKFDNSNGAVSTTVIVAADGNQTEGIDISEFSLDTKSTDIVKVEYGAGGDKSLLVLTPQGPGVDTLNVRFKIIGSNATMLLSCKIKVDLKFHVTGGMFPIPKKILVMDVDGNTGVFPSDYQLKSLTPNITFTPNTVHYELGSDYESNIISVDANGKVTALKAGHATITGKAISDTSINDKIDVIVIPKIRDAANNDLNGHIGDNITAGTKFNTNTLFADRLFWTLYAKNNSGTYVKDETKLFLEHGDKDNISTVGTKTKAGNYKVEILSENTVTTEGERLNILNYPKTIEFGVPLDVKDEKLIMNVNDTFNLGYYNMQATSDFIPNIVSNPDAAIQVNAGVINAIRPGSAVVEFILLDSEAPKYIAADKGKKITLTIEVTEGLYLNMSKASIYVNGTVQLEYMMTNIGKEVQWKSSHPSIATVDDKGLVRGVKPGVCTITAIYIDDKGIERHATCEVTVLDAISGIKLDPAELEVQKGKDAMISAIIDPKNATNVDLSWVSTNDKIATIKSERGSLKAVVTGVAAGTVTIVAINKENAVVGSCKVTVIEEITGIKLSKDEVKINLSEKKFELVATITPATAPNQDVVWESSDKKVVTVSKGVVTLVAAGTATIIASSRTHPDIKAYCKVTVNTGVTGLTLESTSKIMYVGDKSKIGYTVLPAAAENKNVVWSSTNNSVATVDGSGNVSALAVGQTVIIAKTADGGFMQTCTIFVKQEAKTIQFTLKDVTINKGEDYQLQYKLDSDNITDPNITWSSTNPTVATVNAKGIVTGVEVGSTIIMAKLSNGEVAYCNVIVQQAVEGIKLNYSEKTVNVSKTFTLKVAMVPDAATNKKVTWESSNKNIATVSSSGVVKGIKIGTAIIKATSEEGGYVGYCVVTVEDYVTKIKLNKTSYKLALGTSYTLKATVSDATNKKVKWTSSNTSVATVNSNGKVTGRRLGKATITATATDGSNVRATCAIQVVRPVTSIRLNKAALTMIAGRSTKLKATVSPSNATIRSLKWTSSDETVAKVATDGTISALKAGTTTIKAAARDDSGRAAYCLVTVKDYVPASSVSIITQNPVLIRGESFTMTRSVVPANNTDTVTWVSDNNAIVTVNKSTGRLTAKNPGVATVSAITQSGKTSTTQVTVIGLNVTSLTLTQYATYRLVVEGITSGITWDISNPAVAIVTNGNISTRAAGTAIITATVKGRRLSCRLTVTEIR